MTPAALDDATLAATAQRVITALAGPDARVRDDQLAAVRALVLDRRRALVVQATGWGKSAVYWAATAGRPRRRRRPDAGRLAAARADARPGRRRRPGRAARRHAQLHQRRRLGRGRGRRARRRRSTCCWSRPSGWPTRASPPRCCPTCSPRSACSSSTRRTASPTGASTSGPTTSGSPGCCSAARPDLPVLATTATANERVTADVAAQLGDDTVVLRGALARDVAAPGGRARALRPLERYALGRRARCARCPAPASSTCSPSPRPSGSPASCAGRGHDVAAYSGQLETDDRARIEDALRRNELKARRRHLGAGHGLRQARPGVLRARRLARLAGRLLPAGRAGRPRARRTRSRCCCRRESDERIWDYFATATIPDPSTADARARARCADGRRAAVACPRWRPRPACGAAGSRRCSRCSPSTARSSATAERLGGDRRALDVRRRASTRALRRGPRAPRPT